MFSVFDTKGAFKKLFTPTENGYLYYPSKKSGGKLVSSEEHEQLLKDWQKVTGRSGTVKLVGIVFVAMFCWTLVSGSLAIPYWANAAGLALLVLGMATPIYWASYAPYRLVRDRPFVTPPRPTAQVKREVRDMLNWRFTALALVFTGILFATSLTSTEGGLMYWAWLVGSGTLFGSYVWLAVSKLRDR